MKFIIHSKSERGFWSNKQGWVLRATTATKFTKKQMKNITLLPITSGNDAEWLPYQYDY